MPKKKLQIKTTDEQLESLYQSLKSGAPLQLALQRAGISMATYYYWVAISSIVNAVKTQEEIEELEALANSGVSIQSVRDMAESAQAGRKTDIGVFIEVSQESILQYKNNRKFRVFADKCYEIITNCNVARSDFATLQLLKIANSTNKKNGINPSGAMWWLERNLPDFFAKPADKAKESENEPKPTMPAIQVEFVDPATPANTQRLIDMEQQIFKDLKGTGEA